MLLVASETGHVYTFATRKLQPMITSEAGKALIQTCLNSPDPPTGNQGGPGSQGGDQRMSATGFEETELTYNIADEDTKVRQLVYGSGAGMSQVQAHAQHVQQQQQQHYGGHLDSGGISAVGMSPPNTGGGMMAGADQSPSGYQQQHCPSPLPHQAQGAYLHHHNPHQQTLHQSHHNHHHQQHHHHTHAHHQQPTHSHMHHHPQQR